MQPKLFHKHLLIRAEVRKPPQEQFNLTAELRSLVDHIGMRLLSGPHTAWCPVEGNVGYSGVCIIETSSITFHSWTESHYPVIQLDVYTCGTLEIGTVLDWLAQFDPSKIDYKFLDREHSFTEILTQHITLNRSVLNTASSNAVSEQAAVGTRAL